MKLLIDAQLPRRLAHQVFKIPSYWRGCCSVLKPERGASALVIVYGGHLRGQAFLKHSSCGLVESLTTQMTTDEPSTSAEARAS
jgi:hypothetical protein